MKMYAVFDEIFDIKTNGCFEKLTEQQIIDAYFRLSDTDAQLINVFDTEEDATGCLDRIDLCGAKEIDYHHGLVHIAFVRRAAVDGTRISELGDVIKARVGV